jgi:hypothetical protein
MRIADCPLEKKYPSGRKKRKRPKKPRTALRVNATTYSQTGCSGLAPAPELFALRGSGCRNLALRAFVNKPQPFCPALTGSSFAELDAHNSAAEAPGEHITAAAKPTSKHNHNKQKKLFQQFACLTQPIAEAVVPTACLSTGPWSWYKGLYN